MRHDIIVINHLSAAWHYCDKSPGIQLTPTKQVDGALGMFLTRIIIIWCQFCYIIFEVCFVADARCKYWQALKTVPSSSLSITFIPTTPLVVYSIQPKYVIASFPARSGAHLHTTINHHSRPKTLPLYYYPPAQPPSLTHPIPLNLSLSNTTPSLTLSLSKTTPSLTLKHNPHPWLVPQARQRQVGALQSALDQERSAPNDSRGQFSFVNSHEAVDSYYRWWLIVMGDSVMIHVSH